MTFLDEDFDDIGSSAIDNVHLYTGRERDSETGLQLNRHRFYHASLGRWVTRDPIGYWAGDPNLYSYVGSRPTYFEDPSGLIGPFPINPLLPYLGPPGSPGHLQRHYLCPGNSAPADPWWLNWGSEAGAGVAIGAIAGIAFVEAAPALGFGEFMVGMGEGNAVYPFHIYYGWRPGITATWNYAEGVGPGYLTRPITMPPQTWWYVNQIPIRYPGAISWWVNERPPVGNCVGSACWALWQGWFSK